MANKSHNLAILCLLSLLSPLMAAGAKAGQEPAQHHMIAAANPHAARAGREILRLGGSAVDATIAAQMVLTVVEPQSSGIGGGAFLLHFKPGEPGKGIKPKVRAYDGRETTPMAATETMFLDADGKPMKFRPRVLGGTAVGIPGVVRLAELVHSKHGKLPWVRLFADAIRLAEDGFNITPRLRKMIRRNKQMPDFPVARKFFYTDDGEAKAVGTRLVNRELAQVFRRIATEGADAFYKGAIARDIARAASRTHHRPIAMTEADLAAYRAKERDILCGPYRKWRICTMPPPTSGGIATIQILTMLEGFDMAALPPGSLQSVHLISEASRLAFADRDLYVADTDFVKVPVKGLLDRAYLRNRGRTISAVRSMGRAVAGIPPTKHGSLRLDRQAPDDAPKPPSTSHISVIDGSGNAVSMTTSIGSAFGARIMVRGFMLNSQIADFSAAPEKDGVKVANRVEPGKRPRSSMSPTLVLDRDGRLVMTVGSPGGSSIIGYVVRTLIATLDGGLAMQEAINLGNHINRNRKTELEKGTMLEDLAPKLRALGHKIRIRPKTSGLHGIRVLPTSLQGGADSRREGVALGD